MRNARLAYVQVCSHPASHTEADSVLPSNLTAISIALLQCNVVESRRRRTKAQSWEEGSSNPLH